MRLSKISTWALTTAVASAGKGPFLEKINDSTWVIGNDHWNVTQGALYATKLYWDAIPGADLVGSAAGHYVGYDGENNLKFTNATIATRGPNYIDVSFSAAAGDFHWVVFDDLTGAYQYFVNRALPDISILRTLWRLAPEHFPNGRTHLKDEPLPDFALYANATNVQDETWQLADGSFITKYDWSNAVRDRDFYGIYGPRAGSWYIHPTTEYFNSDHLSQTLTIHRESKTGDSVQLNVVQDTSHFRVGQKVTQPAGKVWGPWLWYLNDGNVDDAAQRHKEEVKRVPYTWFEDAAYQSRGGIQGTLALSDGRPASNAAVFLGDADVTIRPSIQGKDYYYTTYADDEGRFTFDKVRAGSYAVYAWSNGGKLADVYTNFTAPVTVSANSTANLGQLSWEVPQGRKRIFQVGEFDKKASGFKNGGAPYRHGAAADSPENLTFVVGESSDSDWYFASSAIGRWTIEFDVPAAEAAANRTAVLSVSLAGYSQSGALDVEVNGRVYGSLGKDVLASDPALYRSGKTSGEWRFVQYEIGAGVLEAGRNTVGFAVTRYTQWRGFMWDSIILEWV
ncbi:rhamnogalacturonate lyase [Colletotrichum plurivorum]|uniref:rhamnogalacturonan endolyase n=1 Tax=Colletotrichum plurivorum TaxID=2175906 RepID=A0A8H6KE28_9PEZI|nr:rhamnogalacturonate lyase [Colletotrichum plurivorum]